MTDSPIRFPGLFGDWAFTASSKAINIGHGIYWYGIIIACGLLLAVVFHFTALPWFVQLALWLVPYFIIGHDVLRKAFMGIKSGEVFDENFLMAVATVGATGCGE